MAVTRISRVRQRARTLSAAILPTASAGPELIIATPAPHPTLGYANDSWESAAIGWCGREP